MKYDLIIGNPPYNDSKDSAAKKNNSKEGQANFYKKFIVKAKTQIKPDGQIAFILPPGAHKDFYKSGLFLDKVTMVPNSVWPKPIQTRLWYSSLTPKSKATITNSTLNKILEYDMNILLNREANAGIKVYNYTRPLTVLTKTEYNKMSKGEQAKYAVGFYLTDSTQNKTNLNILLGYFQLYLDGIGKQWHSFNKCLKYKWLEGIGKDITEKDIINHYGLSEEDINNIKSIKY
jgi:hypothetical protein